MPPLLIKHSHFRGVKRLKTSKFSLKIIHPRRELGHVIIRTLKIHFFSFGNESDTGHLL